MAMLKKKHNNYWGRLLNWMTPDEKSVVFDPIHDYGNSNMERGNNLVFWKFGEHIKTLITLASDAEKQKEIVGWPGATSNEMAIEFDSYFTDCYSEYYEKGLLSEETIVLLKQLDQYLSDRSGDKLPDFWNDDNLGTHPDWEKVRQQSKNILTLMKMDDLDIIYEHESKYEMSNDGKQRLSMQKISTRLRRK
jgi:hypothetical protein